MSELMFLPMQGALQLKQPVCTAAGHVFDGPPRPQALLLNADAALQMIRVAATSQGCVPDSGSK